MFHPPPHPPIHMMGHVHIQQRTHQRARTLPKFVHRRPGIQENPDGSYKIPADDGRGSGTPVVVAVAHPADPNPPAR